MEKNEKKQEQKNRVVEAMLRAREKEMQQGTPEEELPSLSPGEYEDMYQKILSRLKAEGLMDEEPGEDAGEENDSGLVVRRKPSEYRKTAERTESFSETGAEDRSETTESEENEEIRKPEKAEHSKKTERSKKKTDRRPGKILWFQKKAVKAAGVCLIAGAAVFGLSMTSEANRLLLMQTANEVLGTGDLMQVDNGEDRDLARGDEDAAREEISEKLNAGVPEFYYLPEGMAYESYQIFDEVGYAKITYSYQDGFLHLTISNSSTDMSQGDIKEKRDNPEKIETLNGTMDFVIKEMEEGEGQYTANWEYKNVAYSLFGEIDRDELIKILEKISYTM